MKLPLLIIITLMNSPIMQLYYTSITAIPDCTFFNLIETAMYTLRVLKKLSKVFLQKKKNLETKKVLHLTSKHVCYNFKITYKM